MITNRYGFSLNSGFTKIWSPPDLPLLYIGVTFEPIMQSQDPVEPWKGEVWWKGGKTPPTTQGLLESEMETSGSP